MATNLAFEEFTVDDPQIIWRVVMRRGPSERRLRHTTYHISEVEARKEIKRIEVNGGELILCKSYEVTPPDQEE